MMRYHNITKDDMKNGPGLRVVLWLSGCSHCCEDCQNPLTWDPNGGLPFDESAKQELFEALDKPYISGLTLSGGDPMFPQNRSDVRDLAAQVKQRFPEKSIWMYTGDLWETFFDDPVLQYIDVVIDGEFIKDRADKTLHWVGSDNQRVIDVKKGLIKEILHA